MDKKKVYRLKLWPKLVLALLIVSVIIGHFAYQKYDEYLYKKTNEYRLKELGYNDEEVMTILKTLNDDQQQQLLTYGYNEFIPIFITQEYFIWDNLDGYLSQVITQDQDFFKYHGTEGYDYADIIAKINVGTNRDYYDSPVPADVAKDYAILVNKYHQLAPDFAPSDLVSIPLKYRYEGEKKIRREVYNAFLLMWEAAYNAGIYLIVDSAYRDYQTQLSLYNLYEEQRGQKFADSVASRAGFSEYQTGLALNIYSKECANAQTFKDSKTYQWLLANSYKYGFILRYPEGKEDLTGYAFEASHYRYLGVDLATKVYESQLTFDEYYAYYLEN